ncbi:MAG TPA: hypothetical protein VGQ39_04320 [Pyrinomonadaceae bacterium]|nr:hypothetical protein [Pyrinomonadaceae bacterium]
MIRARFSYLKWTAVVAVLVITIIAGVRPSTATIQPPPAGTDLVNEERVLAKFFDDLVAYDKETAKLTAKAKLVSADLIPLQRRSDDLKGRLPGLQNVIAEIVKKLKAADEWNDLDTTTTAKITDASHKSLFQHDSFKQLLESSKSLVSHGNEIGAPLDNIRKKLTSRAVSPYGTGADFEIVRAAYEAPAPVAFVSLRCSIGKIRMGVAIRLGRLTNDLVDRVAAACGVTLGPSPF